MFESGNVVQFKNGPESFHFWGDNVSADFVLVASDQTDAGEGETRIFLSPFTVNVPTDDLLLVAHDDTDDFPDSFTDGWAWWHSLSEEEQEDRIGPCFLEYLG